MIVVVFSDLISCELTIVTLQEFCILKYCPRCGIDGNPQMKTVQHGWVHWWGLELGIMAWIVVASGFFHFLGNAMIIVFLGGMTYVGNRLLTKSCRCCHSITSSLMHLYCHNCGQKLRRIL